ADVVADGGVDAEEAALADLAVAGDNGAGRQEAEVRDAGPVQDLAAAPEHHAVAGAGVPLQNGVLEDEGVGPDRRTRPDEGPRADVADRPVALGHGGPEQPGADAVELREGDGHEGAEPLRREAGFDI